MSKATGQIVGREQQVEAFFKDEYDEPIFRKHLPLTTTLREVRKTNPLGPSDIWIDFYLPGAGRLERMELLLSPRERGALLYYNMNIDDINPIGDEKESLVVTSTFEELIWKWSERIKVALGTESFAVNLDDPRWKPARTDGSVLIYLDGDSSFFRFEREYKSRKVLDTVTLNELSSRASVLCDLMEIMVKDIHTSYPDLEFHERKR
jgi:hypothetical protein